MTGVAVPKYYNPAAVNPLKYAEQMQKRKLLWSKAKTDNKEVGGGCLTPLLNPRLLIFDRRRMSM